MSTVLTTRITSTANASVLARLAERWRPSGLHLAFFAASGELIWHDTHSPRLLSLCAIDLRILTHFITNLHDKLPASHLPILTPAPGLQAHLTPVTHRRRLLGWLVVLARTGTILPSEDIQRAADRAGLDLSALLMAAGRLPLIPSLQLPALVSLVGHMHDDLLASTSSSLELSSVTEQLSGVYEEISLLYKISSGMRFSQKPHTFLEMVCREVQEIGNLSAVAVAYATREEESKPPVVGEMAVLFGPCALQGKNLLDALHAPILESLTLGEACVHNDLSAVTDASGLPASLQRFVCVPLIRDKRYLGILLAIDKNDRSEFTSVDLKLLSNVGNQCSIFLENAALYQDMQDLFMGVLHSLTHSIDAKDAYTRGHSQRVAELSRDLARKIGLPEEQCERVYLSGLLHDVGKIGVPEAVLTKPGRLSDAEFEAIKKHPAIGAQILENIKQLQDVIPGVLYHHERWDGRGYPYNLAGENIPLFGRIICVADSFDAMSSTRTYRPALPLEAALAEILRCAGTQFDPTLAHIFNSLDFGPYRRSISEQLVLAHPSTEASQ